MLNIPAQILTHKRHKAFVVLGFAEFLHEILGLLLGEFFTEIRQQPEEFIAQNGVVLVLVVQLENLNKVVNSTGVLVC